MNDVLKLDIMGVMNQIHLNFKPTDIHGEALKFVLASDYDAIAAQRDEGLARVAELQKRLAEAETQIRLVAHTAGDLLEQVINATEFFDDPISCEEIDETNAVIDSALAFAGPDSADGESSECAHSYANKLGCPECGEDFGK